MLRPRLFLSVAPLANRFVAPFVARVALLVACLAAITASLHAQETWSPVAAPSSQNLWSVAHGAGLFVAVGENGTILTSPDGIAWTPRPSGTTSWLVGVAYAGGRFLAVGDRATVLVSDDGLTWTARNLNVSATERFNAVSFGNGAYLLVGESGLTFSSPDSLAWRSTDGSFPGSRGLAFDYGLFVVTGARGQIATSIDADTFTRHPLGTSAFVESVAFGRNTFLAVGHDGLAVLSPDARRWTGIPTGTTNDLRGLAFFHDSFVAVGENGTILTSPDGRTWTRRPIGAAPLFTAVTASDTIAIAVGHAGTIYRSTPSASAPAIAATPRTFTELAGSNVLLTAAVTGRAPVSLQWFRDGTPLPGATSESLLLSNVQPANSGTYTLVATNAQGRATATVATLTVVPTLPSVAPLVDPSFNASPPPSRAPLAAVEQPDGKLVLGGDFIYLIDGRAQTGLVRLNPDGSLDPTFQPGAGVSGSASRVTRLALQSDGRILLSGEFMTVNGLARPGLARLLPDGTVDPSFNPPAFTALPILTLVQPDGRILIRHGETFSRLLPDGTIDPSFNFAPGVPVSELELTSTGKFIGAFGSFNGSHLVRLNSDGSRDPTFPQVTLPNGSLAAFRVMPDDRIVAATVYVVTTGSWQLQRFNPDGSPDLTFPVLGSLLNRTTPFVFVDREGRVIYQVSPNPIFGNTTPTALRRLNLDGSIDPTFRRADDSTRLVDRTIQRMVPISRDRLLALGEFTTFDGQPRTRIAVLRASNAPAVTPPAIAATSPRIVHARAGDTVTLSVTAAGTRPLEATWTAHNSPAGTASAAGSTYTIPNAQLNSLYSVTLRNPAGEITSPTFLVLVDADAPQITRQPASLALNAGHTAVFTVAATGTEPQSYQWFFNTTPVGANSPTLVLPAVTAAQAGDYTVVIRNSLGTVTSRPARLQIGDTSRLANLATRGHVGPGEDVLIAGFTLSGPVPKTILVRGIGPALTPFGVTDALADPRLTVFDATGRPLAQNDTWSDSASGAHAGIFHQVGAFQLPPGSADAAQLLTLPPGSYTVQISGAANTTGVALAEIYEADLQPTRLVNLSSRLRVGSDSAVAIPGIVIQGDAPRRLLIRAIGPSLAAFGVAAPLADPVLRLTTATGTAITENDNWSENSYAYEIESASASVAAFPLAAETRDAVLLVTLAPGNYTAHISGTNSTTGIALVEVYELP